MFFSSITEALAFLVIVGLNLSSKTFYKYKNTEKIYKEWSFHTKDYILMIFPIALSLYQVSI